MSQTILPQRHIQTYEHDLASRRNGQEEGNSQQNNDQDEQSSRVSEDQGADQTNNNMLLESERNEMQPQQEDNDEVPTNKDQLLAFLQKKLEQAEIPMSNVFIAIQIEREKREKLMGELEGMRKELDEFNNAEENFLTEKVQDRMTLAIQKAVEDRVIAENEANEVAMQLQEKQFMITELDENIQSLNKQKGMIEMAADDAQYNINQQESIIESFHKEITQLDNQNAQKDKEIWELKTEINDMKSILETLILMKDKLNFYIPNEVSKQPSRKNSREMVRTPKTILIGKSNNGDNLRESGAFEKTPKRSYPPKEDDFWYSMPTNAFDNTKTSHQKKNGPEHESVPNKNPNYNSGQDEKISGFRTVEYRPIQPTVKLPVIKKGRSEYLYKNKEYMDEFESKSPNGKNSYKSLHLKKKIY